MATGKRRAILVAGKARYVSPNRGIALLDEAIEQVTLQSLAGDKGQWNQADWRCGSGMCLAGWIDQLAGGEWLTPAGDQFEDYMVAEDSDQGDPDYGDPPVDALGRHGVHAADRAERLLAPDVSRYTADALFAGDNTLQDIKDIRASIPAGGHDGGERKQGYQEEADYEHGHGYHEAGDY